MGFRGLGNPARRAPMTYFVSLKITALLIGLFYVVTHLPGALAPAWTARRVKALPRIIPSASC